VALGEGKRLRSDDQGKTVLPLPATALLATGPRGWRVTGLPLPAGDDLVRPYRSTLTVLEDGRPLGPPHELHQIICQHGGGGFSHWQGMVLFSTSDNSSPLTNGRQYAVVFDRDAEDRNARHALRDGETLARHVGDLPPERRAALFAALAHDHLDDGDSRNGLRFACRAWRLGRRDRALWLAVFICLRDQGRFAEAVDVVRGAAQAAREAGDALWAADIWSQWEQFVFARYGTTRDMPFQDEFVAPAVLSALAEGAPPPRPIRQGRLRVGYVAAAEVEPNYSSLPEIAADLVLGHDPRQVEACFISRHDEALCLERNPFFPKVRQALADAGRAAHFFPARSGIALHAWRDLADRIAALDLDVLVLLSQSGVAGALAALRPARRVVSLGLGDVHLYTSRILDLTAHFSLKPAMDGFSPSAVVPCFMPAGRFNAPDAPLPRHGLGVPDDAPVLVVSARAVKYREPDLWAALVRVLEASPQAWLVAIGLEEADARHFLEQADGLHVADRVRPLGWRNDHHAVLAACDVCLDTFPNGGGYAVFEAVSLGLAAVAVTEDYLEPFDERTWAPAAEFLPGIGIGRDEVVAILCRLLADPAARAEAAAKGRQALGKLSDGAGTARALEKLFRQRFAAASPGSAAHN
jgi:glycosyltransferase involved in cell wall biosynthesis